MKQLNSEYQLGEIVPNIASLLKSNVNKFSGRYVYFEKNSEDIYEGIKWDKFYHNIENIAYNLSKAGFKKGEKMILFSKNRLEMLELELAIMAYGGIAVPIFAHFKQYTAELLINHSDATWIAVGGPPQIKNIGDGLKQIKSIIYFDEVIDDRFSNLIPFSDLLVDAPKWDSSCFDHSIEPDAICLNMYTSGTMGTPKCVQLMHKNILSQQAAIDIVWDVNENDRLLAYLPWHHSFGGIFELFTALYNGATYFLESSYGKDADSIFENWRIVKPTVFFSVPRVYQSLYEKTLASKEAEEIFFNSGLKFIFTAAASLPEKLSQEFQKRNIPVIEGWGLTETSPCCTLTNPDLKRMSGVVGKPIPGVGIRISKNGEIQVKGPNVMDSYYNNDEANDNIFTNDGWYRTGDVGKITETGVKLIARKDRIFKLSNGEKVVPTDLEKAIQLKCHYIKHVIISGSGEDYPVALIFPNKKFLNNPNYEISPEEGCYCPRTLHELTKCLHGCLHDTNCDIKQKFSKIKSASVIDSELSIDDRTLTPSMKVAPNNILEKYKTHLKNMYGKNVPIDEEVYIIKLDVKNNIARKSV
jgi:long-subunit acyl-CoA synthetase (AMP-forming)